jgi:hypothetical protein
MILPADDPLAGGHVCGEARGEGTVNVFTRGEGLYCNNIRAKDVALRQFLAANLLPDPVSASEWLAYLVGIKNALGNLSNDISFIATLLIKNYLAQRFEIDDFDAAAKPQGAPGIDIEAKSKDGRTIIGELKTTKPYQPGFGAAQRASILKDLARLSQSAADYRLMFVIDSDAFNALVHERLASKAPGVEVIDLVSGKSFLCPA